MARKPTRSTTSRVDITKLGPEDIKKLGVGGLREALASVIRRPGIGKGAMGGGLASSHKDHNSHSSTVD